MSAPALTNEKALRATANAHSNDPSTALYREYLQATFAEIDRLRSRLHDAAMTRVWTNEDGKKFVFVDDIAPHLLGISPKPSTR